MAGAGAVVGGAAGLGGCPPAGTAWGVAGAGAEGAGVEGAGVDGVAGTAGVADVVAVVAGVKASLATRLSVQFEHPAVSRSAARSRGGTCPRARRWGRERPGSVRLPRSGPSALLRALPNRPLLPRASYPARFRAANREGGNPFVREGINLRSPLSTGLYVQDHIHQGVTTC